MANRNGTVNKPGEIAGQRQKVQDDPVNDRQKWIDQGDVLGLLDWLRSRSVTRLPTSAMDDVAKAIRRLERKDVDALVETAYAEIIGLTTLLLLRNQLHIEKRLAEADLSSGASTHLPYDLIDEDWIGRIERTTRFLMEITSTRERVRHIARLNANAKRKDQHQLNGPSLEPGTRKTRNGQAASSNGWISRPESRIRFP